MNKRAIRLGACFAGMLVIGLCIGGICVTGAYADNAVAWTPPTQPLSTTFQQDGKTCRYVNAAMTFSDEEPLEFCGVNNTVAFYRKLSDMNTTDPSSASYYTLNPLFGVYGSEANQNPDPYLWNLFYNTYLDANGMDASLKSTEAADTSKSPFSEVSGTGTNSFLKYRPDILYPDDDSDLGTLTQGVQTINGFTADSEYYKAKSATYVGDTDYNPMVAYREGQGMNSEINSVHNVAQTTNDTINLAQSQGVNLVNRYSEDPTVTANKYEEFIRATEYYIQSKIADGTVNKKKVIYVDEVTEDGKITAYDVRDPNSCNSYADYTSQGSMGVVDNPIMGRAGAGKNQGFMGHAMVEITPEEAASADVIVMVEPDNYGNSDQIASSNSNDVSASVQATRLKDLFTKNGYTDQAQRKIYTTNGNLVMGSGYRSLAGAVQIYAWTNAFIYPELLNSVDMTAYFYETFYHLKGDALQQALTLNLGDTLSMPDGQSLQDLSSYNASDIDAKFDQGMAYYLQNKDAIVAADPELEASSTLVKSYESNHPNVTRLAGDTRFDTMEQIDATGFDSADTVVLTSSTSFADALSASSLAGVNNAPILITDSQTLSDQTKATIARLGASKVYLIGGEAAVSSDVENQLQALKTSAGANVSVERISGEDRRATAIKVADAAAAVSPSDTAIIATGEKFADALSISPYAYSYGVPMYFAQEDGTLDAATVNAIARGGYSHLIILGGTNVVSSDVEQQVGGASVTRIAGDNRYDTSSKIASYLIAHRLATIDNAAVATGQDFPDALTGAALCGRNSSVLLLADDTDTSAINSVIKTNQSNIYTLYLLGGTNVLSSNVEQQINAVLTKA